MGITQERRAACCFANFEVDITKGELRENGARVLMREQPFRVLTALLEQAGETFSRDERRRRLWDEGTFVDFVHGLGTAVFKIRDALHDPASTPQFEETVPRQGFRFVAPVKVVMRPPLRRHARLPWTQARAPPDRNAS